MTGDILADLILLVWFLGFIKLYNETAPLPAPEHTIVINGQAVPFYSGEG